MEGGIWAQSLSPLPAQAGASTGNGAMGPCTGKQTSITQASGGGVLPEEARAGLLQSLIKLLAPQKGGWDLGDTACATPQFLHTALWTAHGHVKTKDMVTVEPY